MKKIGFNVWGLLPSHITMLLTLIVPVGIIIMVSFSMRGSYGGFEYNFTTTPYKNLIFKEGWSGETEFNPQYLYIVSRTIILATLTMIICMVISFPVAYWIAQQNAKAKTMLIYLVTLPFWVSMIVRVYAWLIIMGNDGTIESTLRVLGIVDDMKSLLFTNGAMLTGMVYSYIPLMILPVFASVEKLDRALIEASHDLFGSHWTTMRRVILPLAWPGIAAGAILVFVPCLGAVLEPTILGGGKNMMMGNLIQNQFGGSRNWPFGAAIALVMMCLVMIVLITNGLRAAAREKRENA